MASLDNQIKLVEYFRDNLDWCDYMCSALVGCIIAESNIIPNVSLIDWKYDNIKENILEIGFGLNQKQAKEFLDNKGIESLSLEDQLKLIVSQINNGIYKDNFKISMNKCNNLKEAVATVYCRFTNGYSSKTNIPTDKDIRRIDKKYDDIKEGFEKRLKYANQVLDNYHHSIDI